MPTKPPRRRYHKYIALALILLACAYGLGMYQGFWRGYSESQPTTETKPEATISANMFQKETIPTPAADGPLFNHVYLAEVFNEPVLFFRSTDYVLPKKNVSSSDKAYMGLLFDEASNSRDFHYKDLPLSTLNRVSNLSDLTNPQVVSWLQPEDTAWLFLSVNTRFALGEEKQTQHSIYRVNLKNGQRTSLWNSQFGQITYASYAGETHLLAYDEPYLVLKKLACETCTSVLNPSALLIINTETLEEKLVPTASLVELDATLDRLVYTQLLSEIATCGDERVRNTAKCQQANATENPVTIYVPKGDNLTTQLSR